MAGPEDLEPTVPPSLVQLQTIPDKVPGGDSQSCEGTSALSSQLRVPSSKGECDSHRGNLPTLVTTCATMGRA